MPTELVWEAVSLNFHLNNYIWKTPLQWDGSQRRFLYKRGGLRTYFCWYFVVFVLFLGISSNCCVYVIHGQIYHPKAHIKISSTIQYGLLILGSYFVAGIALLLTVRGEYGVLIVNTIIQQHEGFLTDVAGLSKGYWKTKRNNVALNARRVVRSLLFSLRYGPKDSKKFDRMGIALFAMAPVPLLALIGAPAIVLGMDIDVYRYVLEDVVPPWMESILAVRTTLILLRLGMTFALCAEAFRIFSFLAFMLTIPVQISSTIVQNFLRTRLDSSVSQHKCNAFLNRYVAKGLTITAINESLSTQLFALACFGLVGSSCVNFAAIRLLDSDIHFVYYLVFPLVSLAIFSAINFLLPVGIRVHENSKEILRRWRADDGVRHSRQLVKRLKGMRPILYYAGINGYYFFGITKSFLGTFIMSILDYTVELLVSFPAEGFHL